MNRNKFLPLLIVAAGLLAYQNSFHGPFIFDDVVTIADNPTIRQLWPPWQALSPPTSEGSTVQGRPLLNLSLAVNYALGGTNVWGYHAVNLIIHILAGLTLYGIVRRTLLQPGLRDRFGADANGLALAAALLWTVHPLQTEAVTYVIQRAESMVGLLYLLTCYCFIRGAESPRPRLWHFLCVAACVLGMASKELMATAPLMVLLYDRTFVAGSFRNAWRHRWRFYLALAATWLMWAYCVLGAQNLGMQLAIMKQRGINRWSYLLTEPGVILHYLRLSFWPQRLCFDYAGWPMATSLMSVLPSAIAVVVLLGATVWGLKKNAAWGFLGAWFFVILAPTSSFFPLDSPLYEHRLYLPLAAIAAAVAVGIYRLVGQRTPYVIAVLVVGLGLLTWERNQDYRSELAIWTDTAAKRPDNFRAHNNLGALYAQQGDFEEASRHLSLVLKYQPNDAEAHANLGTICFTHGQLPEAVEHFEAALRSNPRLLPARLTLGIALARLGRRPEAIQTLEELLRIDPENDTARSILSALATRQTMPSTPEDLK